MLALTCPPPDAPRHTPLSVPPFADTTGMPMTVLAVGSARCGLVSTIHGSTARSQCLARLIQRPPRPPLATRPTPIEANSRCPDRSTAVPPPLPGGRPTVAP